MLSLQNKSGEQLTRLKYSSFCLQVICKIGLQFFANFPFLVILNLEGTILDNEAFNTIGRTCSNLRYKTGYWSKLYTIYLTMKLTTPSGEHALISGIELDIEVIHTILDNAAFNTFGRTCSNLRYRTGYWSKPHNTWQCSFQHHRENML